MSDFEKVSVNTAVVIGISTGAVIGGGIAATIAYGVMDETTPTTGGLAVAGGAVIGGGIGGGIGYLVASPTKEQKAEAQVKKAVAVIDALFNAADKLLSRGVLTEVTEVEQLRAALAAQKAQQTVAQA